jgi:hypothetical protein
MTSPHAPVLLAEVIEALDPKPGDVIIDATFGAGGYTRAILERGADVVALDRDPTVQPFADAVARDFFRAVPADPHALLGGWPRRLRRAARPSWTAPSSTSASRPCSWIRPSAASPSCATGRWTCG